MVSLQNIWILTSNAKSNEAQNYRGELQIVTKRMANDGIRNWVGQLDENEQKIVDCLISNREFSFNLI
ncbi:phospho-sugar glycosidase domain-containing protein [Spiroplasma poulsonii]|uniref:phospho-sugar glycosidase domain-containing protein n=1 Tax=Spiroplasma poulsonii TaxID=2138 RepID=UPI001F4C87D8|nr:phospho-sugar glycosidase domain-containing protein [Spiroplasma poulsonii]UNF61404.1 DUF871 domain-containing protein [Spiroplasma poulsonii]